MQPTTQAVGEKLKVRKPRKGRKRRYDTASGRHGLQYIPSVGIHIPYYDMRMPGEPLHIEIDSGTPPGQRVLRLTIPYSSPISFFFEFQSLVRSSTSPTLILDLTRAATAE